MNQIAPVAKSKTRITVLNPVGYPPKITDKTAAPRRILRIPNAEKMRSTRWPESSSGSKVTQAVFVQVKRIPFWERHR